MPAKNLSKAYYNMGAGGSGGATNAGNQNTYNDYYNVPKYSESQSSASKSTKSKFVPQENKNDLITEFVVKEIEEDPSIGQMTKAIYIKD